MAIQDGNDVGFCFTTSEAYATITKDDGSFYYLTDTHELYIGSNNVSVPKSYVNEVVGDISSELLDLTDPSQIEEEET